MNHNILFLRYHKREPVLLHPTLHRQNSFRREPERNHTGTNSFPQRNLGSSSPSIRFYSDTSEPERPHVTNSVPRRSVVSSSPSRRFHSDVSESDRPHSVTTSVPRRNCLVSSSPSRRFGSDISEHDIQQPLTNSLPRRYLSSSSPSRRFNSDTNREIQKNRPKESCNNNEATSKKNAASVCSSARNKENVCPSPWNNAMRDGSSMKKTETCTYKIDPGADQDAVGQMLSKHDWDSLPIDDIDNPLIALDCFIFL
ncbi:hypothetical protein IFM89_001731 [Coptis chinensis]|uniref:Uncharacterized protein n=1 Tax=Coptis chinensis TaxID=261450 RepID=A0A835LLW9_9MAGN|nr:hypothetical protein IFM89_001731 [Coptis chinensis]